MLSCTGAGQVELLLWVAMMTRRICAHCPLRLLNVQEPAGTCVETRYTFPDMDTTTPESGQATRRLA